MVIVYGLIFILGLILDQLSKYWISTNYQLYQSSEVIPGIFDITYIKNAGAAFGILQNHQIIFIIITFVVILLMGYYFIISSKHEKLLRVSLTLIACGGIGNLIDRIRFGYVVDFLYVKFWPVFNFADSYVTIGTILLIYILLFKSSSEVKHGAA